MPSALIGLDLAWSPRNTTGLALGLLTPATPEHPATLEVVHLAVVLSNEEILGAIGAWLAETGAESAVCAIDAPLVVPNLSGSRWADRLATRLLGPFKAGVYPANRNWLGKYGGERIWDLADTLCRELAFAYPAADQPLPQQSLAEVYPHAVQLAAFGLTERLKYKSGGDRAALERDMGRLRKGLGSLAGADPALTPHPILVDSPPHNLRGKARKAYEDQLDALCCLYMAGAMAAHPPKQVLLCGSAETPAEHGAIVVPDGWANEAYSKRLRQLEQEQGWHFGRMQ